MIKESLPAVKLATHCVLLPEVKYGGRLAPTGSGFFVSADGWFVTAHHVLTERGERVEMERNDVGKLRAVQPVDGEKGHETVKLDFVASSNRDDFALLKAKKRKRGGFPYVEVSTRRLAEADEVYWFGYMYSDLVDYHKRRLEPSSLYSVSMMNDWVLVLKPRLCTGVISAVTLPSTSVRGMRYGPAYGIDRQLELGMSGAPVVSVDTGRVCAIATSAEASSIPQEHIFGRPTIAVLSAHSEASSMSSDAIAKILRNHGIAIRDD